METSTETKEPSKFWDIIGTIIGATIAILLIWILGMIVLVVSFLIIFLIEINRLSIITFVNSIGPSLIVLISILVLIIIMVVIPFMIGCIVLIGISYCYDEWKKKSSSKV